MTPLGCESVGVIIPAWNEASNIAGCLGALFSISPASNSSGSRSSWSRTVVRTRPRRSRDAFWPVPRQASGWSVRTTAGRQGRGRSTRASRTYFARLIRSRPFIWMRTSSCRVTRSPRSSKPRTTMALAAFRPVHSCVSRATPGAQLRAGVAAIAPCQRRRDRGRLLRRQSVWTEPVAGFSRARRGRRVRALAFAPHERFVLDGRAYFMLRFPDGPDFVRTLARWRRGNRELHDTGRVFFDRSAAGVPVVGSSDAVGVAARSVVPHRQCCLVAPRSDRRIMVARPATCRRLSCAEATPRSPAGALGRCGGRHPPERDPCRSLSRTRCGTPSARAARSTWSTTDRPTGPWPRSAEIANDDAKPRRDPATNVGFGAAVNATASRLGGDYLLLVNPDVVLEPDAVDALVRLARQYPRAGLYGGQAFDPTSGAPGCSSLPVPSVWEALMFASGVASLRARSRHDSRPTPRCNGESVQAVRGARGFGPPHLA